MKKKIKINRSKFIKIKASKVSGKGGFMPLIPKWKQIIVDFIKVEAVGEYLFSYDIQYYGVLKLKKEQLVCNSQEVLFLVVEDYKGYAKLITMNHHVIEPLIGNKLFFVDAV